MLLSFLVEAAFSSSVSTPFLRRFVIISAAFDGMEGNSGCMGAVIDSSSPARAKEKVHSVRALTPTPIYVVRNV